MTPLRAMLIALWMLPRERAEILLLITDVTRRLHNLAAELRTEGDEWKAELIEAMIDDLARQVQAVEPPELVRIRPPAQDLDSLDSFEQIAGAAVGRGRRAA